MIRLSLYIIGFENRHVGVLKTHKNKIHKCSFRYSASRSKKSREDE